MARRRMVLLSFLCSGLACASRTPSCPPPGTSPTPTPTATTLVAGAPTLVGPAAGAVIPQNVAASGCALDAKAGYGYSIAFSWLAPAPATGISGYHLVVKKSSASIALVDVFVDGLSYTANKCGYVIASNIEGWEWEVQATGSGGQLGPFSETRIFAFAPCLVGDAPCSQ
jgi:hypothetical protein